MNLVANSEKMRAVVRQAERVAPTDATVLITGESGTGKNFVSEFIHRHSTRAARNLVKIDCAALPSDLIEAELFGFERGAFTGATETRPGRLEAAHRSTLLLDEVALLPLAAQAKLLRVLEERQFERLSGRKTIKIDVRIIATTNADLELAMRRKTFREDLFYRLNVVRLELPPVRERFSDIAELSSSLLIFFAAKHGREKIKLANDALAQLEQYDFPGNVRELANLLERALLNSSGDLITARDLPPLALLSRRKQTDKTWLTLAELEARHVRETLQQTSGNKAKAARLLGISRKNLYEKLARYTRNNEISFDLDRQNQG